MKRKDLTRRQFLGTSVALVTTACAPMILPSSAFGANARIAVAQIGSGSRAGAHIGTYMRLPNAQMLACCDSFKSRREGQTAMVNEHYAKKTKTSTYTGCKAYRDFRDVLARDDIDAVSIATPDHWHVPIAIAAVKAGKDVYVEKPLGVSMAWNYALRDIVNERKAIFQYGTQQRSERHFRLACELVRNGYIGDLERMDVWAPDISTQYKGFNVERYGSEVEVPVPEDLDYDMWLGPAPKAPYTVDRCTQYGAWHIYDYALGFIAGWGAHPLDIAQWGNNTDHTAPVKYEGTGALPEKGLYDTVESWDLQCEYANGVKMHFMDHRAAEPIISGYREYKEHGTTFFGSEGWVSVDRGGLYSSNPKLPKQRIKSSEVNLYESKDQFGNFIDCVQSRDATINPVESAVQSDLISHLGNACIRSGRTIQWDAEKETIVNDAEAMNMLDRPLRSPWQL